VPRLDGEGAGVPVATEADSRTVGWIVLYADWIGVAGGPDLEVRLARVNDGPGLVATADAKPVGALVLEIADGLIQRIDLMANPDKLAGLRG
jgi:hypothetical protein